MLEITVDPTHSHTFRVRGEIYSLEIKGVGGYFEKKERTSEGGQLVTQWSWVSIWAFHNGEKLSIRIDQDGHDPFTTEKIESLFREKFGFIFNWV